MVVILSPQKCCVPAVTKTHLSMDMESIFESELFHLFHEAPKAQNPDSNRSSCNVPQRGQRGMKSWV